MIFVRLSVYFVADLSGNSRPVLVERAETVWKGETDYLYSLLCCLRPCSSLVVLLLMLLREHHLLLGCLFYCFHPLARCS